ncbi:hypothetical protein EG329_012491 [Mollisiaceae sp. DMI_Dod_QoI]|nr:hypothetical protein EG329_012491 [Helotiales sp. DMI_Dod_QoI]
MHLLPDGTDDIHFPGPPFWERLWASGSLTFNPEVKWMMRYRLKGVLQEDVEDVKVKGIDGEEKVFVTVSRKVAMYPALRLDPEPKANSPVFPPDLRTLNGTDLTTRKLGELAMEEKKTLVFVRRKTQEEVKQSLESVPRVIYPIHKPDFSITLCPKAPLLFRFSALTFNAHQIHLDRHYCRSAGHRNLLVHGPLSQVLMLSVLRSQLDQTKREMVLRFDYKNLTPLYVYKSMRICTRRNPDNPKKFDVWIEGPQGGYAVKATAEIGTEQDSDLETSAPLECVEPNMETGNI